MENFVEFFVIAVLIERFTEWIKQLFGNKLPEKVGNLNVHLLMAFIVSVAVTVALGVDIFAEMGMVFSVPYMGVILTAWALSGGANYLFDLIKRLREPFNPAVSVDIEKVENIDTVVK